MHRTCRWVAIAAALFIGGGAVAAGAKEYVSDEALGRYHLYARETLDRDILPALIAAAPASERANLSALEIHVTHDANPYKLGVVRDSAGRVARLELSAGFVAALDQGSDASLVAGAAGRNRSIVPFAEKQVAFYRRVFRDGVSPPRTSTFAEYIGWRDDRYEAFRLSPAYQRTRTAANLQSLAWTVAHLVEHTHVSTAEEAALDRKATERAYAAGFSPSPPLLNVIQIAALEDRRDDADYVCRAYAVAERSLAVSSRDPDAARRFGVAADAASYFESQQRELRALQLARRCEGVAP